MGATQCPDLASQNLSDPNSVTLSDLKKKIFVLKASKKSSKFGKTTVLPVVAPL